MFCQLVVSVNLSCTRRKGHWYDVAKERLLQVHNWVWDFEASFYNQVEFKVLIFFQLFMTNCIVASYFLLLLLCNLFQCKLCPANNSVCLYRSWYCLLYATMGINPRQLIDYRKVLRNRLTYIHAANLISFSD